MVALLAYLVAIFLFSPCGNVGIITEHSTRVRRVSWKSRTTKRGGGTWGNAGCVHFALLLQSRHFWRLT